MVDVKLQSFIAVVEKGTYSAAANELHLTQSAVSQQLKQLENELSIKIFNRVGTESKLTKEGQILYKYSRRIISLYQDLETRLLDEKKQTKTLLVGITHTSESNIIAYVLAKYGNSHKGTKIQIRTDSINNLYDQLLSYEIDLAIVEGSLNSKKVSSILLDTDSLLVVMCKENPLASKKIIDINDLKKERMILRSKGSSTRNLFIQQLQNDKMNIDEFNVVLEVDNIATIKDLIAKNYGISILPKSVCYEEIKNHSLEVRSIANFHMNREINLVFLNDFTDTQILKDLVSIYQEMSILEPNN